MSGTTFRILLVAGGLGAAAAIIGAVLEPDAAAPAYLAAWSAWSAIPIGCLPVLMALTLVRGRPSEALRPTLEAALGALPATALLFLPVLLALRLIYPWARDPGSIGPGAFRAAWLSPGFFGLRAVAYLAIFCGLAWAMRRARSDSARFRIASGGLVVYALVATLSAVDWTLSVEPRFHSSIWGLIAISEQILAGLAFATCGALLGFPGSSTGTERSTAGLAALLISALLLWVYLHAMQFIVVWSGNIPVEADWYLRRGSGLWGGLLILLALAQGLGPFLLLLLPGVRRSRIALILLAGLSLLLRPVETAWLVLPAARAETVSAWWVLPCFLAIAGLGGASLAIRRGRGQPLHGQ